MEEFKNGIVYQGDCTEQLKNVKDKSQQLICIDPPYNIGKDYWDIIPDYQKWMKDVNILLTTKLKPNGTFIIFHNDFDALARIHFNIIDNTKLVLNDFCVWNKRYEGSKKKGFLDGFVVKKNAHKFEKMAEYFLVYTFDNRWKLKARREELELPQITIAKEILSKNGGMTGWYANFEAGLNWPTKDTIKPIEKHLGLSYEEIVPKFNNQKIHHSIMNFDSESKQGHLTPKPIALLEHLVLTFTDKGDEILDCFAGSGSTGVAASNLDRKFIMIEQDKDYIEIIKKRLNILKLF